MIRYPFTYVAILLFACQSLIYASSDECEGSGVTPEDGTVIVETGTKRKGRRTVPDIEIAHVKWTPKIEKNKEFFENYDLSMRELEFRANGSWETYTSNKKTEYNGYYSWNVPRKPCLEYEYRIVVPHKSGQGCVGTKATKLLRENIETIRESKFTPDPPIDVVVNPDATNANITWNRSRCAEEYEVYIETEQSTTTGQEIRNTVMQPVNVETVETYFADLKSCTNYQVEIYPKVKDAELGDRFATTSFNTKPDIESASHLKLDDLTYTENSATLQFYTWMGKVHCLKNFTIETCNNKNECVNKMNFAEIKNHEGVKYVSKGLQHCTKYFLKVLPTFVGVNIKAKEAAFVTELDESKDEAKKFNVDFIPGANNVSILVSNVDCLNAYTVYYHLNDNNEGSGSEDEWIKKYVEKVDNSLSIEDLKPNSSYLVNMTGSLNGNQLSLFEMKEFKTLLRYKPTTTQIILQTSHPTDGQSAESLDIGSEQNYGILPRHNSETGSLSQGKASFKEKRSEDKPKNNFACTFKEFNRIVYFTLILTVHSISTLFL